MTTLTVLGLILAVSFLHSMMADSPGSTGGSAPSGTEGSGGETPSNVAPSEDDSDVADELPPPVDVAAVKAVIAREKGRSAGAPKAEPKTEAKPEEPAPPAQPPAAPSEPSTGLEGFHPQLVQIAQQALGMTPEQIKATGSSVGLEAVLRLAAAQRQAQQSQPQAAGQTPEWFKPDWGNAEEVDDRLMKNFSGLNDRVAQEFQQVKMVLGAMAQQYQQQQTLAHQQMMQQAQDSLHSQVDEWFGNLADGEELFGKGSLQDLDPKSPLVANRLAVFEEADQLARALAEKGQRVPPLPELLAKARIRAFAEQTVKQAQEKAIKDVQGKLHDQQGRFISRPASRNAPPPPKGDATAIRAVAEKQRQLGIGPEFSGEEDDDE